MTAALVTSRESAATASRVVVRPAEPRDNAARCDLFARVTMASDLVLSVHRGPDFDALYRLQTDRWLSVVLELDGAIEGTAALLVRDGYIGGVRRRVGYLGDLRFSPKLEGRMLLDRHFRPLLEEARERFGCELLLTAVIASNQKALRALTRETPRSRRAGRPRYTPVGDFDIRSIHLLLPRRPERSPFAVRRATERDIPALARLLDSDARSRPFGYVFSEAELRRRLREWPGLSVESFLVAESGSGELAGTLALWDASAVKRMVVEEYRGAMRRVRFGYDLAARVLGVPRLPARGEALRYVYVTHQAIPSGDPRILRALLTTAHRDARGSGPQLIMTCAPRGSTLEPAFRGFMCTSLPARLFAVTLPEIELPAGVASTWPGFEMALV